MRSRHFLLLALFVLLFPYRSVAQGSGVYITSAKFYICADFWCDIYVNGIPLINYSYTENDGAKHPFEFICKPKHLCYFHGENSLAIQVCDTLRKPRSADPRIGVAYILRFGLSDGTERTLSSNETEEHSCYYRPVSDRVMGSPFHWNRPDFEDGSWQKARSTGTFIPGLASLVDPETGAKIGFLSASGISSQVQFPGERHYFRRKFFLNVDPNPMCLGTPIAAPKPTATPTETPALSNITTVPSEGERPLEPTLTQTPSYSPTEMPKPFVEKPVPTRQVLSPSYRWVPSSTPTRTPFAKIPTPVRRKKIKKVTGLSKKPTATITSTATPTATLEKKEGEGIDHGQTIVSDDSTANIYLSFADGPGTYRLEVLDEEGHHLSDLFDKKVVAPTDTWVEWDGKTDSGRDVPPGMDLAVFSKDGRVLKKIFILRKSAVSGTE